jgi:hypothetical protein
VGLLKNDALMDVTFRRFVHAMASATDTAQRDASQSVLKELAVQMPKPIMVAAEELESDGTWG